MWRFDNLPAKARLETQRRLAAILAADVAGYSRLVEDDEDGTLRTLSAYREVIDEIATSVRRGSRPACGDGMRVHRHDDLAVHCAEIALPSNAMPSWISTLKRAKLRQLNRGA